MVVIIFIVVTSSLSWLSSFWWWCVLLNVTRVGSIQNTAPKTLSHYEVCPRLHKPFEGHCWVRYGPGSHEATPRKISGERGRPAFTRTIPSPLDHRGAPHLPLLADGASVLSLPLAFILCRLYVGHVVVSFAVHASALPRVSLTLNTFHFDL